MAVEKYVRFVLHGTLLGKKLMYGSYCAGTAEWTMSGNTNAGRQEAQPQSLR